MSIYLVTGAAGFIGAAVARRLLAGGHRVIVIDNLSTGFREHVPEGAEFFEGGTEDDRMYRAIPQVPYDAIFHIAGQSSGEISFDDPVYDLQTNTQSTLLLLRFAGRTGCRSIVYASSMSVYGDQPDGPVREDAVPTPKSFYGVGKLASEHYLRIYSDFGLSTTALRLFNVYGPGQNMENMRQGMVSIYLSQALKNRQVVVKGGADRYRDFVYIDDVVEAFVAASRRDAAGFVVCNVATGIRTTVGALLDQIRAGLPFETPVTFAGSTPGDQFGIVADIGRAAEMLDWRPRMPLAAGVQTMIRWAQGLPIR